MREGRCGAGCGTAQFILGQCVCVCVDIDDDWITGKKKVRWSAQTRRLDRSLPLSRCGENAWPGVLLLCCLPACLLLMWLVGKIWLLIPRIWGEPMDSHVRREYQTHQQWRQSVVPRIVLHPASRILDSLRSLSLARLLPEPHFRGGAR